MIEEILKSLEDKRKAAHKVLDDFYDNPPKKRKYAKVPKTRAYNSMTLKEGRKPYVHSEKYYQARREAV